jgi:hypothetical protein
MADKTVEELLLEVKSYIAVAGDSFGGAIVIIPPEGEPKTLVLTASKPNNKFFWAQVTMLIEVSTAEIDNDEMALRGFR